MNSVGDLYISTDIEADGPIPGPYSMLSFGLAIASSFDGVRFEPRDPPGPVFYRELKPISSNFVDEAVSVSGLDRDLLQREGSDPVQVMMEAADWVKDQTAEARPVLVAYPVVFDWMFIHWYFVRYVGASPFGFSGAIDMKTMYQQKAHVTLNSAGRKDLPTELTSSRHHTHNAAEDAIEQAEIFNRLFIWGGVTR